mmetsp:Transcript_28097/g.56732  ORF Transcript_28097/g.56732 Transcript_28097/m.56732 type:complete len:707 (+) Transcript_28097:97-2217(+)
MSPAGRRCSFPRCLLPFCCMIAMCLLHYMHLSLVLSSGNETREEFDAPNFGVGRNTKTLTTTRHHHDHTDLNYSQLNYTIISTFCTECRYDPPTMGGKTCLDRAKFLHQRHSGSFPMLADAVQSVKESGGRQCEMIKYLFQDEKFDDYFESLDISVGSNGKGVNRDTREEEAKSVLLSLLDLPQSSSQLEFGNDDDSFRFNSSSNRNIVISDKKIYRHETPSSANLLSSSSPSLPPHIPKAFKFYIYENLPSKMTEDIERQILEAYSSNAITYQNFKADLVILRLFRSHPSRVFHINDDANQNRSRTRGANAADNAAINLENIDLFVVPYPHASHCLLSPNWKNECMHVDDSLIQSQVLDKLNYYKGDLKRRHLFINTMEVFLAHPLLRTIGRSLTLGPRLSSIHSNVNHHDNDELFEHLIVPYFKDEPGYQPSIIHSCPLSLWYTRPRKYSFAYFYGSTNRRMTRNYRIHRQYFLEEVAMNWKKVDLIGGKPFILEKIGHDGGSESDIESGQHGEQTQKRYNQMKTYSQSVFCPTLPGDSPPQKRFFDVILAGCIPVVLVFNTNTKAANHLNSDGGRNDSERYGDFGKGDSKHNHTSWFSADSNGYTVQDSYPWAKHSSTLPPDREIDYESFVVQIYGGVKNIKPTLEALMENQTEIQRRQLELGKVAKYFTYGAGEDAHVYEDAFSMMLESVIYSLNSGKDYSG